MPLETWPQVLKKSSCKKTAVLTYCRSIIQKRRVSGHRMLCQSVLKHLRHTGSVMKSVKERGTWQSVLRTWFYHKCFVSHSFLRDFSLAKIHKSVWIFYTWRQEKPCLCVFSLRTLWMHFDKVKSHESISAFKVIKVKSCSQSLFLKIVLFIYFY